MRAAPAVGAAPIKAQMIAIYTLHQPEACCNYSERLSGDLSEFGHRTIVLRHFGVECPPEVAMWAAPDALNIATPAIGAICSNRASRPWCSRM